MLSVFVYAVSQSTGLERVDPKHVILLGLHLTGLPAIGVTPAAFPHQSLVVPSALNMGLRGAVHFSLPPGPVGAPRHAVHKQELDP